MNFQVRVGVEPLGRLPRPAPPDGGHHAKVRHSEKFQTWPRPAEAAAAPANTRYGLRQRPGLPGPRFPRLRNGATASSHPCGPCKLWGAVLPLWAWLVSLQGPSLRAASPPAGRPSPWLPGPGPAQGGVSLARGAAGGCRRCSADWLSPLGLRLPVLVKGLLGPGCRAGPGLEAALPSQEARRGVGTDDHRYGWQSCVRAPTLSAVWEGVFCPLPFPAPDPGAQKGEQVELRLGPSVRPARSPPPERVPGVQPPRCPRAQPPRCPSSKGGQPRMLGSRRGCCSCTPSAGPGAGHTRRVSRRCLPADEGSCWGASLGLLGDPAPECLFGSGDLPSAAPGQAHEVRECPLGGSAGPGTGAWGGGSPPSLRRLVWTLGTGYWALRQHGGDGGHVQREVPRAEGRWGSEGGTPSPRSQAWGRLRK